jgi:hypothetical protein
MKPTILAALCLVLGISAAAAQHRGPGNPNDLVREDESGPPVAGGTGATVGPNYKNQAVTPMPGREDLTKRRPGEASLPPPDVRPAARPLPEDRKR